MEEERDDKQKTSRGERVTLGEKKKDRKADRPRQTERQTDSETERKTERQKQGDRWKERDILIANSLAGSEVQKVTTSYITQ